MENKTTPSTLPQVFAALGDPIRLAMIERLAARGALAAGELGAGFAVSAPAISRHLAVLHAAGLVQRRADKQRRIYSVAPEAMQEIAQWMMSRQDFWQGSLQRLDALLAIEEENR